MDGEIVGLIIALITSIGTLIKYFDEKKKAKREEARWALEKEKLELENSKLKSENKDVNIKLQFLDRVLDLEFINALVVSVERMFARTKADRFLILIAVNGKTDFNIVNVVFEQHQSKEYKINAIARYRNVHIDHPYKALLKEVELKGVVTLETAHMEDSILKSFYELENIKFSKVRHLARKPINNDDDFLMFSSLATHSNTNFTKLEQAYIKTQYEGVIIPSLDKVLNHEE